MSRPFHPSELSGPGVPPATSAELAETVATARLLEAQLAAGDIHPTAGFADRVMDAVAEEPRPQPAIAAGLAMRRGRFGTMVAALADSCRVAFSGGRPLAVRAQAAAFVIVALLAVGSLGGIAAVGAVNLLAPARSPIVSPPATPPVAPTAEPPSRPPAATDRPQATETPEPTETTEPSETPESTRTPRPTRTEHSGQAPEPTETDDGGGGGGGGGGGSGDGGSGGGGSGGGGD